MFPNYIDYTKCIKHWNQRKMKPVLYIVLHNTAASVSSALSWFENPKSKVSAHYIMGRDGTAYLTVNEENVAWHAGNSFINWNSIGIEIEATANDRGLTQPQEECLIKLINNLKLKYDVPIWNLMLHRWAKTNTDCPTLVWSTDDDFIHWRQRCFELK